MVQFAAAFADVHGRTAGMHFNASGPDNAAALANAFAGKSDASWVGLQKIESVAVDSGTFTNYRAGGKPVAGCDVRDQGYLFYGVQSRRQTLRITIPCVVAALLASTKKKIGADPVAGVGKLVDEEAVTTTSFVRGIYHWGKRKGL